MTIDRMFDIKDSALVSKMLELIDMKVPFTLKELSKEVGIPHKTVERRVHRMKQAGLITNRRVGRRWLWNLGNVEQPILNANSGRAFMVISGEISPSLRLVSDEEAPQEAPHEDPHFEICSSPQTEEAPQEDPQQTPQEAPQFSSSNYKSTSTNNTQQEYNNRIVLLGHDVESRCPREKEESMPIVRGPESPLLRSIQEVLANTKQPQKVKRSKNRMSSHDRLRERMEEKRESEYNVTDMRFLYEDLWADKSWTTYPTRWTLKDKKLVRCLLDEQGGENTVRYFQYVVQRWEDIQQRYRIQGSPSVPVMWGFRRSLLHEALEGVTEFRSHTLEYEEDDTADGSFM